ncbi:hypothetical protein BKA65DRAFT_396859 [Rhexocercosporidium sp. MPI-PUGE-AT-0058]|nr:hypothetical protein BKA65DRAFT_396859 [Rhexocercosporidium sp. MPI-PUGE-AT-0058]
MSPSNGKTLKKTTRTFKPQFQFINSTEPGRNKDPAVRKLIRRHVRHENYSRSRWNCSADALKRTPRSNTEAKTLLVPPLLGDPSALSTYCYPLNMSPETHALLEQYLTHATNRMYSKCRFKSSPFRSPIWFHFAVTDPAMLHGVLYAGAVYLALLQGRRETRDTIYHQSEAISIVQKRLATSDYNFEDSTLGTISCLALGEAILGNQHHWHLHMQGLKQIIRERGDLPSLDPLLRAKLRRADVTGAIDYGATPYLEFERSTDKSIWSILPTGTLQTIREDMTELLAVCGVHPSLISTMINLAYFSHAIQENNTKRVCFDPIAFSDDLYWIEHDLLCFPITLSTNIPGTNLDKALRFGALLYTKTILQEFPNSMTGPTILLARLQESLSEISISESVTTSITPLLGLLSLIGGMLSRGEGRDWFVAHLRVVRNANRVTSFDELAGGLNRLLCLGSVFENACEAIWLDIANNAGSRGDQER